MMKENVIRCSICGKEINERESNNASPFKGRCCNECNIKKIVPTRYALSKGYALMFDAFDNKVDCIIHPEKLKLKDLQDRVNGYIEPIFLDNTYVVIVNEEGRLKNLPVNRPWSKTKWSELCVPLVGNVILMRKEQLK